MAKFPNMKMTQQGMDMLARAGSGKTEDRLIITHVMLGDGQFDGEIRTLTDVVSPKKEVTLASYLNLGNGKAQCEFIYNNEGIKTGFYHREVGLYGKNGDDGTVKLISYSNAGNYTSYIADESEIMPYQTLRIGIAIGNNDNVTGLIDVNNALTLEKYYVLLEEHNKDKEAHGTAIDEKLEDHDEAENAHEPAFIAKFKAHNADTDAHKDFVGATASAAGARGMVPAPAAGAQNTVLTGGKVWSLIEELNVALGTIAAPKADTAALKTLLGGIAYVLKEITGESDWKGNPKINLATLFTLVGNLSSGSDVTWDGQKFTNAKLGVSGLMAQNGYIQFGKNFGGLIVQWGTGTLESDVTEYIVTYPIAVSECLGLFTIILNSEAHYGADYALQIKSLSQSQATLFLETYTLDTVAYREGFKWIAICH